MQPDGLFDSIWFGPQHVGLMAIIFHTSRGSALCLYFVMLWCQEFDYVFVRNASLKAAAGSKKRKR